MSQAIVVCTFCAVLCSSWLENTEAQFRNEHDSWKSIIQSIETLNKIVGNLKAEMKLQSLMLSNLASKEEAQSIVLNDLSTKLDMKMQETSFKTLEAKAAVHDSSLNNLQATVDELKTLLINSNLKESEQLINSLSNLEAQSDIQTKVETTCNEEAASTDTPHFSAYKGTVEGIIAGTSKGIVIIPLDLQEQITISIKDTLGVAFNWQSRKVYWIEYKAGIKIANLDGSLVELLVAGS